jgi:enterochelin esterase-like enzyme
LFFGLTKPTEKSRDGGGHLPIFEDMPIEKSSELLPERLSLPSALLGHSVQIDLYWPPGLRAVPVDKRQTTAELSLLLINDGQDLEKIGFWEMLDGLYLRGALAPLLCVGIHAGHQRKMEYGTAGLPDCRGRGAMAMRYSRFIVDELLPRLEGRVSASGEGGMSGFGEGGMSAFREGRISAFRERAFAGFSLGALSAMDIVWSHPREFSKAGLFSGAFWWRRKDKDDPGYRDETDRIMHSRVREGRYSPGLKFFFECGTEDEKEDRNHNGIIDSIDDTRDLIAALTAKGYDPEKDIHYMEIEKGRHDLATWAMAMPEFLKWGWGQHQ